ncbi:uncharacterized protein [Arachis hypogaea]|uniref:uncharacterized protein isoform X2 n=1 Tax=Arachis hypogaea TaxID=3818 RepID=UPI003B21FD2B
MSHAIECARSLHLPPKSCECVELVYQVGICGEHGRSHLLLHSLLKLVLTMSHTLLLGNIISAFLSLSPVEIQNTVNHVIQCARSLHQPSKGSMIRLETSE